MRQGFVELAKPCISHPQIDFRLAKLRVDLQCLLKADDTFFYAAGTRSG